VCLQGEVATKLERLESRQLAANTLLQELATVVREASARSSGSEKNIICTSCSKHAESVSAPWPFLPLDLLK